MTKVTDIEGNEIDHELGLAMKDVPGVRSVTVIPGKRIGDLTQEEIRGLGPATRRLLIRVNNTGSN